MHPEDGQIGVYGHLAQALGEEYTVRGLQAAGLYTGTEPLATVADHGPRLRRRGPSGPTTGPYLLGGPASAPPSRYEMAVLLGDVRLLAVIDDDLLEEAPADPAEALAGRQTRDLVPEDASLEFAERALRVRRANEDAVA